MAVEYHIAAVGGSNENEVSVDLADILNTLRAQDWRLNAAMPLKRHAPVDLSREIPSTSRATQ